MRLGVATPGVPLATVRECLAAGNGPTASWAVTRAHRCGRLGVSLQSVMVLTLCVRRCAVSVHTAERVLDAVAALDACDCPHYRVRVVDGRPVPRWLRRRFDCPVRPVVSDSGGRVAAENQHTP